MQEVFEKIIERLEENQTIVFHLEGGKPTQSIDLVKAIEIVKQTAKEYNNGWIPCSERLPEENVEVLVTICEIDGCTYTGTSWVQDGVWVIKKTPSKPTVIAWQPLPEPYQPKGE